MPPPPIPPRFDPASSAVPPPPQVRAFPPPPPAVVLSPEARRRVRKRNALIASAVLLVALGSAIGGYVAYDLTRPLGPLEPEDAAALTAEVQYAFSMGTAPPPARSVSDAQFTEIQDALRKFGASVLAHDPKATARVMATDRCIDEVGRQLTPSVATQFAKERATYLKAISEAATYERSIKGWSKLQLKQARRLPTRGDVVAIATTSNDDGEAPNRMRFWLHRDGGNWKVYDWSHLTTRLRYTSLVAEDIELPESTRKEAASQKRTAALGAFNAEDYAAAEKHYASLDFEALPPRVRAFQRMLYGISLIELNRPAEAMQRLDEVQQSGMHFPIANLHRATAQVRMGEYAEAEAPARQFVDEVGASALGSERLAEALIGLKRPAEATEALRRGLDQEPDSITCLSLLATVLPADQQSEIVDRFARTPITLGRFRELCRRLDREGLPAALSAVVDLYEPNAEQPIDVDFFRGAALFLQERYTDAADYFKRHLRTEDSFYTKAIQTRYLQAMVSAKRPLEAYRAAWRPDDAFAYLMDEIGWAKDQKKDANALLAEHIKSRPDDYRGWMWQGRYANADKRYAEAADYFAMAMQRYQGDEERVRSMLRRGRVVAMYDSGHGLDAYRDVAADEAGFAQLARNYSADQDVAGLRQLIAAHRGKFPRDPNLQLQEGIAFYIERDYRSAIVHCDAFRRATGPEEPLRYTAGNYLVRAALRGGDTDRLRTEANRLRAAKESDLSDITELLLYASVDDATNARRAAMACMDDDWTARELLEHEDLAPLLQRPVMAELRRELLSMVPPATQPTTAPATQPEAGVP